MNAPSIFWMFFLPMQALIAGNAVVSWLERTLTPDQFRKRNERECIPYIYHGAIIGELLIISWLVARCASHYGYQWSFLRCAACGMTSLVLSIVLTHFWSGGSIPSCFSSRSRVHMVGWIHVLYMTISMTVFFLFYFCTVGVLKEEYVRVSVLLIIHQCVLSENLLYRCNLIRPRWWPLRLRRDERRQPIISASIFLGVMAVRYLDLYY